VRGYEGSGNTGADTEFRRNPKGLENDLVGFHATIDVLKGDRHPRFTHVPELESPATSDEERKVMMMQRGFQRTGQPLIAPPGMPKELAEMLCRGFRRTYENLEFHKAYRKLAGADATPIVPEAHENVIQEIPWNPEIVAIFKHIVGAGLPTGTLGRWKTAAAVKGQRDSFLCRS